MIQLLGLIHHFVTGTNDGEPMTSEIVVIGARRSNAPEYWEDSRIAFLEGDEVVRRGLPKNAKVVVFTRFMGHAQYDKALEEAKKRQLRVIPGLTGSGQLKTTLSQLLATCQTHDVKENTVPTMQEAFKNAKTQTIPAPEPEKRTPRGTLVNWMREYLKARPEATRTEAIQAAVAAGFNKSGGNSAFYAAKGHPKTGSRKKVTAAAEAPSRLVALVDEAIAALQLVREEARLMDKQSVKMKKLMEAMKGFTE